jgi:hypothetical protein
MTCGIQPSITEAIEASFPTIGSLGATIYWNERDCHYLAYARGVYAADPRNDACVVEGKLPPAIFDAQASADYERLRGVFARGNAPVAFFAVDFDSDGKVGRGTGFTLDGCRTFFYDPGWKSLPSDDPGTKSSVIDSDWYETDFCQ